jgi:hypothetical protein
MEQMSLPSLEHAPNLGERGFIQLARQWNEAFTAVIHEHPPPHVVDELALTAILLSREHGASFTDIAWRQAEANIALAESRTVSWIDCLPWRLAASARLLEPGEGSGFKDLVSNLNHHNSSLRIWTMELGWMLRPLLKCDTALPPLLENVAGTLAGVEMAWGLAGALFDLEIASHEPTLNRPCKVASQHIVSIIGVLT